MSFLYTSELEGDLKVFKPGSKKSSYKSSVCQDATRSHLEI